MRTFLTFTLATVFLISFSAFASPKYEIRAVWVATVKNIDWPSAPNLSVEEQKKEICDYLDLVKNLNLNTVYLQVRPSSDALYHSLLEPWSVYLTGKSGVPPNPYYDPLKFWIEEAHKRTIDLHAWINPFRASMSVDEDFSDNHPVRKHPDWFIEYNNKYQYDPGNPKCREHIARVVKDMVVRYDLDGIHMDDYFYPYPVAGLPFGDSISFKKCFEADSTITIADWRRSNVDKAIYLISKTIKETKPWVAFGISPFGVWRNQSDDATGSATKAGITNYDDLYADILKWMKEGWIDYVVPQIYWDTNHKTANFKVLARWWSDHSFYTPVVIGHGMYRVNPNNQPWSDPNQLPSQIEFTRDSIGISGNAFFSINHFKRDLLGFQDSLKSNYYKYPALIPVIIDSIEETTPWFDLWLKRWFCSLKLKCEPDRGAIKRFIIYSYRPSDQDPMMYSDNIYLITKEKKVKIDKKRYSKGEIRYFRVEAIDKYNRSCGMSPPVKVKF